MLTDGDVRRTADGGCMPILYKLANELSAQVSYQGRWVYQWLRNDKWKLMVPMNF